MEFSAISSRANAIRAKYRELELKKYGREWTSEEVALGFVGDVGDLMKLVIAKNGARDIPDAEAKLAHELADCLWSVIVLSDMFGIDLEVEFAKTMDMLEEKVGALLAA